MKVPLQPPPMHELFPKDPKVLPQLMGIGPAPDGKYRHWDTLRRIEPPNGLTTEQWWLGIKFARSALMRQVPLQDVNGQHFTYCTPDAVLEVLHEIDRDASGQIGVSDEVTNPNTRDRYIVNSLIEESITSSQLEGASTTSQVARDMIRSGRKPADRSERMILNNYRAMTHVREHKDETITPEIILQLHKVVTEGTLDSPKAEGNFRTPEDKIFVSDEIGKKLFEPPPADQLKERVNKLSKFARGEPSQQFIHPVIRAIIIHFWLAYDHPFKDGNGRTARALFYWSMLSHGYWLFDYVSISHILKNAPAQYGRSFLYTETDDNDLTYFVLYQLKIIRRAIEELHVYLTRKVTEVGKTEKILRQSGAFNHRQLALLSHALRHPDAMYSIQSHRHGHSVSYQTARTDLLDLASRDLLTQVKIGKAYYFILGSKLTEQIKRTS